jgi:hypothetical protein
MCVSVVWSFELLINQLHPQNTTKTCFVARAVRFSHFTAHGCHCHRREKSSPHNMTCIFFMFKRFREKVLHVSPLCALFLSVPHSQLPGKTPLARLGSTPRMPRTPVPCWSGTRHSWSRSRLEQQPSLVPVPKSSSKETAYLDYLAVMFWWHVLMISTCRLWHTHGTHVYITFIWITFRYILLFIHIITCQSYLIIF